MTSFTPRLQLHAVQAAGEIARVVNIKAVGVALQICMTKFPYLKDPLT